MMWMEGVAEPIQTRTLLQVSALGRCYGRCVVTQRYTPPSICGHSGLQPTHATTGPGFGVGRGVACQRLGGTCSIRDDWCEQKPDSLPPKICTRFSFGSRALLKPRFMFIRNVMAEQNGTASSGCHPSLASSIELFTLENGYRTAHSCRHPHGDWGRLGGQLLKETKRNG